MKSSHRLANTAREKVVAANNVFKRAQGLRYRRFGMSVATYSVTILALFFVTRLGLGVMSSTQWAIYTGFVVFGNGVFFVLLFTDANLGFSDPSLTQEQIIFSSLCTMLVLYYLPMARPIVLLFYLPAFSFGMLRLMRRQYFVIVACMMGLYATLLGFEYFKGRQGFKIQYELFLFTLFGILLTWFAFFGGFVSNIKQRLRLQKEELQKSTIEKDNLIFELKDALAKVKTLSGLLPICSHCKKIRDGKGYWNRVESYIQERSDAEFSHGICQECVEKYYPDMNIYDDNGKPTED